MTGNQCAFCGCEDVIVLRSHLVPAGANITVKCASCKRRSVLHYKTPTTTQGQA